MRLFNRSLTGKPEEITSRADFSRNLINLYLNSASIFLPMIAGIFWAERNNRADVAVWILVAGQLVHFLFCRRLNITARMRSAFPDLRFRRNFLATALSTGPLSFVALVVYLARTEKGGARARWLFGPGRALLYAAAALPLVLPVASIFLCLSPGKTNLRLGGVSQLLLGPTNLKIVSLGDEFLASRATAPRTQVEASRQFLHAAQTLRPSSIGMLLVSARALEPFNREPASIQPEDTLRLARGMVTIAINKEPDADLGRFALASALSPAFFVEAMILRAFLQSIEFNLNDKFLIATVKLLKRVDRTSPEARLEVSSLQSALESSEMVHRHVRMLNSRYRIW